MNIPAALLVFVALAARGARGDHHAVDEHADDHAEADDSHSSTDAADVHSDADVHGAADGHGADGGHHWSEDTPEWTFNMCEALMLIVLVLIAVVFEIGWHHVSHSMVHSYRFGNLHDARNSKHGGCEGHAHHQHRALKADLAGRMGGEFMTLGILSFCIFFSNLVGIFDALADSVASGEPHRRLSGDTDGFGRALGRCFGVGVFDALATTFAGLGASSMEGNPRRLAGGATAESDELQWPPTANDWLHLGEFVHMQLFLGMVMYFMIIGSIVHGSVKKIERWEELRIQRVNELMHSADSNVSINAGRDMKEYLMWRTFFIERVIQWQEKRTDLFEKVLKALDIPPDAESKDDLIRKATDSRFSLAAYLASNVETGVHDLIQVHNPSWYALMVLFSMFALLHRFPKVEFATLKYIFLAFAVGIMMMMTFYSAVRAKELEKAYNSMVEIRNTQSGQKPPKTDGVSKGQSALAMEAEDKLNTFNQSFNTEGMVLNILQVALFVISYSFAQSILDKHEWEVDPVRAAVENLCFLIVWILFSQWLPRQVPQFLAIMALPPFVDEENCVFLFKSFVDVHLTEEEKTETRKTHVITEHTETLADAPGDPGDATNARALDVLKQILGKVDPSSDLRQTVDDLQTRVHDLETAGNLKG